MDTRPLKAPMAMKNRNESSCNFNMSKADAGLFGKLSLGGDLILVESVEYKKAFCWESHGFGL